MMREPVCKLIVSLCLAAPALALAQSGPTPLNTPATADAQYREDVARCDLGQSGEDRETCLKEAAATRDAAGKNGLTSADPGAVTQRCDAVPADQRTDCLALMNHPTSTEGSVESGGILRVRETAIPAAPAQ